MTEEKQQRLLEWWEATEQGTVVVKRLVSYITELRLHPESSRADGMILFYRAASEISYGYAGMRGCIRHAFTPEYSEFLRNNIVRCHSFTRKFSVDTKILLERVAKEITGANAMHFSVRKTFKRVLCNLLPYLLLNRKKCLSLPEKCRSCKIHSTFPG
ncbi:hypothetical protein BG07_5308 [Bacillus pseudomycoides]|uniref:hypothetical protein n=1 Tax=Bacillus TaxID=1386 RepID=UPI00036723B2|nr:hypothetical protein [Bacillus pseudomycoides]AIK39095.1 hypothetical protein DJ92_5000 [Bacillus pseudomycoides]AJI18994.1 hypothetical protein BG07_5308 [Bacillus pseudomycoides]